MLKDFFQNKNILMSVSFVVYVLALYSVLNEKSCIVAFILTFFLILLSLKKFFSYKIIIIWALIFYFGVINTSLRIKETDYLLDLAPINSTIYGKIVSIPQNKDNGKVQFFFDVNKIEYDNIVKEFNNEKILVTLNTENKFNIYDSYKISGRLSTPFKAGNPSQFDYGNYLRNYGTYAVFYGKNSQYDKSDYFYQKIDSPINKKEKILQNINNYREKILKIHSKYLQSPNLEILGGIVFGDDAVNPPKNIKQSFINSGLLHILAASGMNVAFIYSFFFLILRFLRIPFKFNISICILAVLTYVLMTGLGASVVRAALMLLFVLVGKLIDRDADNIILLFFVAFLMLIYNPMYLNDVGFQLSFTVTFGLLLMTQYLFVSKYKIINWLIGTVTIPIIAQLWVIPIQIYYFSNISIYSIFANIMSVPILSVISFGGFISSLLSFITPIANIVCKSFDFVLNPLISILVNISDFYGTLPYSNLQTQHPHFIQIIVYYLILVNISWLFNKDYRENFGRKIKTTIAVLVVVLLLSTISFPDKNLEITAFDVGNADAFLVKTPEQKYIMIDTGKSGYNGGKSQAEMLLLKYFKDNGINSLDSIIVTHFDNDHAGGAVDLLSGLKVDKIYVNSKEHTSRTAKEIYQTAKNRNTTLIEADNNQVLLEEPDLKLENYIVKDISGIGDNESSIITLLTYGEFSMLFTGDAGIETLKKLRTYLPSNITILKVGHHGASGVINKDIAEYLNPKYSIISTGENKFGHPSIYTIEILNNSTILRTDINNAIKIIVNRFGYKVKTYNTKYKRFL